jgi:rod shape-determining protein MreD
VALVQTVLLAQVNVLGARPDLMVLVVLGWAIVRGTDQALVWAFIGGLIIDLLSGGPLGATVLALLVAAFIAGQPWGLGIGASFIRLVLLAFLSVMAYHAVLLTVLAWTGHTVSWIWAMTRVAVPSAVLNAVLVPFVQRPLAWLERRLRRETFLA